MQKSSSGDSSSLNSTYSFYEILLRSLSKIVNKFVCIAPHQISENNFNKMRDVVGEFEKLKRNYSKNN